MRLHLYSDLHLERDTDSIERFFNQFDPTGVDIAVLAGDIANAKHLPRVFAQLFDLYPHTIFVPGNHCYYGSWVKVADELIRLTGKVYPNIHVLQNQQINIMGQNFIGGAMFFRDHPMNFTYHNTWSDFRHIKGFVPWVYEQNQLMEHLLNGQMSSQDIVITHYLPSFKSVTEDWKASDTNRFFVCDVEQLILDRQPKLWLHGHSHQSSDYKIGNTRVVNNPRGYEWEEQYHQYKPLLIEVSE